MISDLDIYLFDLRGYLLLEEALAASEVAACNAILDDLRSTKPGEWNGYVHGHFFSSKTEGLNLQQIYEAGDPFEKLIDHPSWIEHVRHFVGGEGTFDYNHGPLFIDENFANIRGRGESIGIHSGPVPWIKRCQFQVQNQRFNCGQINVVVALTDIGPGDGATVVIPSSHKSNFVHPEFEKARMGKDGGSAEGVTGAIELHMKAGDVALFVDAICHGSARRVKDGERRNVVYRYGPSWGFFRHGYRPSKELLDRLTPERRQIVWPHDKIAGSPYKAGL